MRALLDRLSRVPIVTRLLAALTVVLVVSFVVTYFVTSNLSREALRRQAESVLTSRADQGRSILLGDVQPIIAELQFFGERFPADLGPIDAADRRALTGALADVHRRRDFTVLGIYSRDGGTTLAPFGPRIEQPPTAVFTDPEASFSGRIVPTTEGGLAYVAAERISGPPHELLVVFGYRIDHAYARRIRDAAGGSDVVLVAADEPVATSLAGPADASLLPSGRTSAGTPVVDVDGTTYWSQYHDFARPSDDWGMPGALGVLIPEPLAELDAQLLRNRLIATGVLLVLVTVLAWLVTRRVTQPLRELTTTASRIARGDLGASFEVTSRDEVGTLAAALEGMRRGLGTQLVLIQRQARALRDAAGRLVRAQDEARRRLAGELHDGVQRQLVMLRIDLGFGRKRIREDPACAEEVLDELTEEIDQVLGRLRETAQGIYPSILGDRGLQGALFSMASRSSHRIELQTDPDPLPRLPREVEANAYFLASEAVTNAIKHAEADRIVIVVRREVASLELVVQDDGRGFETRTAEGGQGLATMRDRAHALGGRVRIDSDGNGTTVRATLPVDASVDRALQVEQDGRDTSVQLEVLLESELLEDRIDVLLDRSLGDVEGLGDGPVASPGRHQGEDVEFPRGEPGES